MNVIETARELGKALQADERYQAYIVAKEKNDNDEALQAMIGEFNLKRVSLSQAMAQQDKDQELISKLNEEIKHLYAKIMQNPNMTEYQRTKESIDKILDQINTILTFSANGEDPATCPDTIEHSCSGSCSSCSGCH